MIYICLIICVFPVVLFNYIRKIVNSLFLMFRSLRVNFKVGWCSLRQAQGTPTNCQLLLKGAVFTSKIRMIFEM